ncbi:MAG: hypothetical protein KIT19_12480 [Phycisphaeraceae bacterium]|nr:hypothetical protein [Phycisphaeraceae bacterium]
MPTKPKKPEPFDPDRAFAIFNDGHSINAAVARATRAAAESHKPPRCPTCGTPQPPSTVHPPT